MLQLTVSISVTMLMVILGCASLANASPFPAFSLKEGTHRSSIDETTEFFGRHFSGVVRQAWGHPSNVSFSRAVGYLDLSGHRPMLHDTRFPIASNTKLYVSIALYQLQEKGLVDLQRPINAYLTTKDFENFGIMGMSQYCPKVQNSTSTVCPNMTFVQMMTMTAGIANSPVDQFLPFAGSLGLCIGRYINHDLLFVPGTRYYYSNPSFMFLAYFVEKLSGVGFNAYIQKHILHPLGLSHLKGSSSSSASASKPSDEDDEERSHDLWWGSSTYFDPNDGQFGYDPDRASEYIEYYEPTTTQQKNAADGNAMKKKKSAKDKKRLAVGRCSSEFNTGSAGGAGGIISTAHDEAVLYMTLFNFSRPASEWGRPLFASNASLMEILYPRTAIPGSPGVYYGQGILVTNLHNTLLPEQISYEGGLICARTQNILDLTRTPPLMTQVWSASLVYYVNASLLNAARLSPVGNWFADTATPGWTPRTPISDIAWSLARNPPSGNGTV